MRCVQVTAEGFLQAVDTAVSQCQGTYLVEPQDLATMAAWLDPSIIGGQATLVAMCGGTFTAIITVYFMAWGYAKASSIVRMR